jgi:hypothetical protein
MMGLMIFQEVINYYEKRKAAGKLAEFRVGITELGAISTQSGYMIAEGTQAQITELVNDEEFKRLITKATHVVPFSINRCATGAGVATAVERLLHVRKELGIG